MIRDSYFTGAGAERDFLLNVNQGDTSQKRSFVVEKSYQLDNSKQKNSGNTGRNSFEGSFAAQDLPKSKYNKQKEEGQNKSSTIPLEETPNKPQLDDQKPQK